MLLQKQPQKIGYQCLKLKRSTCTKKSMSGWKSLLSHSNVTGQNGQISLFFFLSQNFEKVSPENN